MAARVKYKAYQQQDSRRLRPEVVFSAALLFFFFIGMAFVLFDLSKHPDVTDESNNNAILGEFNSTRADYKSVETKYYTFDIPTDWVQVNSPEVLVNGLQYYPDRFQGVTGDHVGRWVEVYRKKLPDRPVDKVLAIEPAGNGVIVGEISPQCASFTEDPDKDDDTVSYTPTIWEANEMSFVCTMSENSNIIAAYSPGNTTRQGVQIGSDTLGEMRYLFIFSDHGSREDNSIFQRILQSFETK